MSKLPAKQIYLLLIIVTGIITLSVYSTYAIFTLESETSDIVSIQTSNVLNIQSNTYEYKQITIPKNSYMTTDVDIYNNFDYELCYAIWYKVASSSNKNKIKIYQDSDKSLTTSGTIDKYNSRRITLIITNDNDAYAKVNIGVFYSKNEGTCELNISKDKSLILKTINEIEIFSDTLIKNISKENNISNYLTYKNKEDVIELSNENKINISTSYTYKDEIFTLIDPIEIDSSEIIKYSSQNNTNYYTCLENKECNIIYRIIEAKDEDSLFKITKYDKLVGYLSGESGLKKVTSNNINNYYYYGDNPNNFIYYNCKNSSDTKTCELWRMIGIFYNDKDNSYITKIIRNDSIGKYQYNESNNSWIDSNISKALNEEYKLNSDSNIKVFNFPLENAITLNISLKDITNTKEINDYNIILMNLSDYLNASICQDKKINEYDKECLNNNWLNNGEINTEWTMSAKYEEPYIDAKNNETINPLNNTIYTVGKSINESLITDELDTRPVIYLNSNTILIDGDGSFNNPYIVR